MIKAIETRYSGYRFRSRLEARWAVFFDALEIEYQYEPEGFDLGELGWYLPDFWLPEQQIWIEIKGATPTQDERCKVSLLAEGTKKDGWILSGNIGEIDTCNGDLCDLNIGFFDPLYKAWGVVGNLNTYFSDDYLSSWCQAIVDFIRSNQGKMEEPKFEDWIPPEMEIKTIKDIQRVVVMDKQYHHRQYGKLQKYYSCNNLRVRTGWFWDKDESGKMYMDGGWREASLDSDFISQAYRAARSARFEHGETP